MLRTTPTVLIITLILPPAIIAAAPGSSLSTGVLMCSMLWALAALTSSDPPYSFNKSAAGRCAIALLVVTGLLIHAAVARQKVAGVDFGRLSTSCVLLMLECIAALLAADKLLRVPDTVPIRAAGVALGFLTACAFAGIMGAPTVGGFAYSKGVVFFAEPSHFALAFLPMLMITVSTRRRSTQLLLIGTGLLIGAALPNLTTGVGVLVIAAILLRSTAMLVLMLALAAAAVTLDFTYYLARLDFTSETTNLSTLVFLQGWENAMLNFQETDGFGVGFQQFGVAGSTGDISEKIALLLEGDYINLMDGGSTASKMVGEFGVFGILALFAYAALAWRSMLFIRRQQRLEPAERDRRRLFFSSLIVTFLFEILIRGMGYFSAGGFLTLTALMALPSLNSEHRSQTMLRVNDTTSSPQPETNGAAG